MARQERKYSQTDYYHVMLRGNNKSDIFEKEESKAYFAQCVKKLEDENILQTAAWCIMDNHVHLVVKVELNNIETAFKRLNVKYAMYYNRSNHAVGHVFQDRFRSETIETDEALINVIRYVHNNPLKARICKSIDAYPWSSYHEYLSQMHNDTLAFVWSLFGGNVESFNELHSKPEEGFFLDIKEDQEKIKQDIAQKVITEICSRHGIVNAKEISKNSDLLQKLIKGISVQSGLSGRKIAKLLGLSEATVRRAQSK